MRKILVITNMYPDSLDPAKGVFVRNIVHNLRRNVVECEVIALSNTKNFLRKTFAYAIFFVRGVGWIYKNRDALVYVHYASHCAPIVLFALALGVDRMIATHVHGSDICPEGNVHPLFDRLKLIASHALLRRSDLIVVPSSYFRDVVIKTTGVDSARIFVSPSGGVDMTIFTPNGEKSPSGALRIGFVGRLTEDKGIVDFLNLLRDLRSRGMVLEVIVVGDGPQLALVTSAVAAGELVHYRFLNHPQLAEVYRDLDLFLFPTRRDSESLGLVGLEAMACGTPVAAYSGAGPDTFVIEGETGFLAPRGDWRRLADIVAGFAAATPEDRRRMGTAAYALAQKYDAVRTNAALVECLKTFDGTPLDHP